MISKQFRHFPPDLRFSRAFPDSAFDHVLNDSSIGNGLHASLTSARYILRGNGNNGSWTSQPRANGFVMWDALDAAVNSLFVGPVWPASVLVLLVVAYLMLSLMGAVNFDAPDMAIDADGWQSLGATSLRWLNLGQVPIILWLGCFSILYWLVSYTLWTFFESERYQPTLGESAFLATRNAIIAILGTKLLTGPIVPYLAEGTGYSEETIIGERCVISSMQATPDFGQAKYSTGGAPLLLNIRTDGSTLAKGDAAIIVAYDTERRLYTVTSEHPLPVNSSLLENSHEKQS